MCTPLKDNILRSGVNNMAKRNFFNPIFFWGIVLLHVYVMLNRISKAGDRRSSGGGCPFTMAKSFLGRQSCLIATSLFYGRPISINNSKASSVLKTSDLPLVGSRGGGGRGAFSALEYVRKSGIRDDSQLLLPPFELFAATQPITSHKVAPVQTTIAVPFEKTAEAIAEHHYKSPKAATDGKKKKKQRGGKTEPLETIVIGLSHHNAKVEVREKLAIPEADWNAASEQLCEYDSISEAAVLSTCNRFEIYIAGKNQYAAMRDAIDFLYQRARGTLDFPTLRQNLFLLSGEDAIWHLMRVSAGLDSLVVGEGQILAQVKRCYERSIEPGGNGEHQQMGSGGKVVSRLLNTAVTAGKRVRSETGISKGAVSISSAAAEFTATKIEPDCKVAKMEDAKIAIVGAGKMARLLLIHLQTQGVTKVTIVNRSMERVLALQEEFPQLEIDIKLMDDMWDVVREADVVYPSTAATSTIIDPEPLRAALEKGRSRPGGVQFVDISVPRNVHPDCQEIDGVFCYNVDDLKVRASQSVA